jgi:hypothetical protein
VGTWGRSRDGHVVATRVSPSSGIVSYEATISFEWEPLSTVLALSAQCREPKIYSGLIGGESFRYIYHDPGCLDGIKHILAEKMPFQCSVGTHNDLFSGSVKVMVV